MGLYEDMIAERQEAASYTGNVEKLLKIVDAEYRTSQAGNEYMSFALERVEDKKEDGANKKAFFRIMYSPDRDKGEMKHYSDGQKKITVQFLSVIPDEVIKKSIIKNMIDPKKLIGTYFWGTLNITQEGAEIIPFKFKAASQEQIEAIVGADKDDKIGEEEIPF